MVKSQIVECTLRDDSPPVQRGGHCSRARVMTYVETAVGDMLRVVRAGFRLDAVPIELRVRADILRFYIGVCAEGSASCAPWARDVGGAEIRDPSKKVAAKKFFPRACTEHMVNC
jgi:hypothetical protein